MKRVLIAYFSPTGHTEKMALFIAEGVRFAGHEAEVRKIEDLTPASDLGEYDGYIFGSPTYFTDMPPRVKEFLSLVHQHAELEGKPAGAFGSYTHEISYKHENYAPEIILREMAKGDRVNPFELGPFNLNESLIETAEGMKTCQDYGRVFGERLT